MPASGPAQQTPSAGWSAAVDFQADNLPAGTYRLIVTPYYERTGTYTIRLS